MFKGSEKTEFCLCSSLSKPRCQLKRMLNSLHLPCRWPQDYHLWVWMTEDVLDTRFATTGIVARRGKHVFIHYVLVWNKSHKEVQHRHHLSSNWMKVLTKTGLNILLKKRPVNFFSFLCICNWCSHNKSPNDLATGWNVKTKLELLLSRRVFFFNFCYTRVKREDFYLEKTSSTRMENYVGDQPFFLNFIWDSDQNKFDDLMYVQRCVYIAPTHRPFVPSICRPGPPWNSYPLLGQQAKPFPGLSIKKDSKTRNEQRGTKIPRCCIKIVLFAGNALCIGVSTCPG